MPDPVTARVRQSLEMIGLRRHQLIILKENFGDNQLQSVAAKLNLPYLNVNLVLSTALKDAPVRRRPHKVLDVLSDAIKRTGEKDVCLDHIELCFEPTLRQDPIRLLEHLSREFTLVVSWKGPCEGDELVYAEPEHPEYVRSRVDGIIIET